MNPAPKTAAPPKTMATVLPVLFPLLLSFPGQIIFSLAYIHTIIRQIITMNIFVLILYSFLPCLPGYELPGIPSG